MVRKSNLELGVECDKFENLPHLPPLTRYFLTFVYSFPYYHDGPDLYHRGIPDYYYRFYIRDCDAVLGYIPAAVVDRMPWTQEWLVDRERKRVTFMFERKTESREKDGSTAMAQFLSSVRDQKSFHVLEGWRNELYAIYGPG